MGSTSARARIERSVSFACPFCGTTATLRLVGRGSASASTGPYGLDAAGGRAEAQLLAEQAAEADVLAGARLARCPRCRRADEAWRLLGWLAYWHEALLALCLALSATAALVFVGHALGIDLEHGRAAEVLGPVAGALGLLAPALTAAGLHVRRLREVDGAAWG